MKLVLLLVLAALPLCCYAGAGCQLLEDIIADFIDLDVSEKELLESLQHFISSKLTAKALGKLKQCFLIQSNETLGNVQVMMEAIYDSKYCKNY